MKKVFILLVVCLFSIWLMPLAALVKPSQDKLICDGQRAICLCRHQPSAESRQPSKMVSFQTGAETQKESSGGMSPRFLTKSFSLNGILSSPAMTMPEYRWLYSFRLSSAFEHVPKVV